MALNYIWAGLFLVGLAVALVRFTILWFQTGEFLAGTETLSGLTDQLFSMAETGFTIALGLTGMLTLWSGIMKIGEAGGVIQLFSRWMHPVFSRLFPDIPNGHPASGAIMMNFSANMLGLDNAATPLGLKAMGHLQDLNPDKKTISNAQIMFLVLNTAGFTLIPATMMATRAAAHAANPTDIFIPTLLTTFVGAIAALLMVCSVQRISLRQTPLLLFLGLSSSAMIGFYYGVKDLDKATLESLSKFLSSFIIFGFIGFFLIMGLKKRIKLFDVFVEGAKDGFQTAVRIIPYLVAMLVAVGVFRASGALDLLLGGIIYLAQQVSDNTDFVYALPTGVMRSLSASASKGFMLDIWNNPAFGVDSFVGKMTSVMQGSSETTFYVIALYCGSVNLQNTRYVLKMGLLADLAAMIFAILFSYLLF